MTVNLQRLREIHDLSDKFSEKIAAAVDQFGREHRHELTLAEWIMVFENTMFSIRNVERFKVNKELEDHVHFLNSRTSRP